MSARSCLGGIRWDAADGAGGDGGGLRLRHAISFNMLLFAFQTQLIDLSTVDVILISNYHCMMALPYITEHTGFTGTVYATEPTVQIGR